MSVPNSHLHSLIYALLHIVSTLLPDIQKGLTARHFNMQSDHFAVYLGALYIEHLEANGFNCQIVFFIYNSIIMPFS